jgi:diguanylate cyclase (GGDEF)-like protein
MKNYRWKDARFRANPLFPSMLLSLFFLLIIGGASPLSGHEKVVKLGVLANKGIVTAYNRWNPTAEYLNRQIPDYSFQIMPLLFEEVETAVKNGKVDFILTNTSQYIELESLYGVNRILTLMDDGLTVFGGTIFCMADRHDIQSIQDLKGKAFMAVDQSSLGGWRSALRELKDYGIQPFKDFKSLRFSGSHDDVVFAVLSRKVDAGTSRTGTLEKLAKEGKININSLRILNEKKYQGFPLRISTRLYPEWPLAKLKHTSDNLSKTVSTALLQMPATSAAARAAEISGWTIPLDYYPVHELMKELRLRPYENYGKVTVRGIISQYWYMVLIVFIVFLSMISFLLYAEKINRKLKDTQDELKKANTFLEFHAARDSLTALYNRRKFNEFLESEIERSRRHHTPFSLILFDIDNFKKINDTYGHNTGDMILKELAHTVAEAIRKYDILARWGGEEFVILVPGSSLEKTAIMAESMRARIERIAFSEGGTVTCSFGVTEWRNDDNVDSVVKRADDALYKAKELGRNRIEAN